MRTTFIIVGLALALVASGADRRGLLLGKRTAVAATPSATTNIFNGTSLTVAVPSGVAAGGVLMLTVISDSSANITNTSIALTPVNTNTAGQSGFNAQVRATDGTESGNLQVDFDFTELGVAILSYWPNCTTNFADGVATATSAPGAGVAMTSASITTSSAGCYVASVFYIDPAGAPTFTNVAPYLVLEQSVASGNAAAALTYVQQSSAGAQTQQIISDTGGTWGTFSISFKP